ncbi:nucleotidyltransferase family protein [Paenibacillus sp. OSY-SE]|uniref:nucleotidyltransferase family protein n=1 Tax=Paenibacillus sp. OSY-SE TaxID=1196323 RepID=UPI00030A8238|nr:nucleotidyltransferase family protein [Paenibacillus sp. OSY-SE]
MDTLPQYELEEIRLVDSLPDNMNYRGLYTRLDTPSIITKTGDKPVNDAELLKSFFLSQADLLKELKLVESLNLPECYIAAGYVRNRIWDMLHGYEMSDLNDIDVVYYNVEDITEATDILIENRLIEVTGNEKWSVKNQARMHLRNNNAPYQSTSHALSYWTETATAVGVRWRNNEIEICSPYGLDDLFQMHVRRCPLFEDVHFFRERVHAKKWLERWPLLKMIET